MEGPPSHGLRLLRRPYRDQRRPQCEGRRAFGLVELFRGGGVWRLGDGWVLLAANTRLDRTSAVAAPDSLRKGGIDAAEPPSYDSAMRIAMVVGLLAIGAIIAYGVIDDQPPKDIMAGVFGVLLLAVLVVLMPLLGRACEAEDRFWRSMGRRIRHFGNRNARSS
jgi:hypothetical protein